MDDYLVHPYMPNSTKKNMEEMLKTIGVSKVSDIYESVIPMNLRFKGKMNLPEPIHSEIALKKHIVELLNKNISCAEYINFLGAGCYDRYVPAICDEIANRAEFLTAYCGDTYSDHGKLQAIFEYTSLIAELLDLDVVGYTTYDAGQAVSSSIRMALRINNKRKKVLVPSNMNPEIYSQAKSYCKGFGNLIKIKSKYGLIDIEDFKSKLDDDVAAIYLENPTFLGAFEENSEELIKMAHRKGAIAIVNPSLSSLGIIEPPSNYGADITCGEIQELGIHMNYGGGCGGFIATRSEKEYIEQYPTYLYGIAKTKKDGQFGWGRALNYRCSHEGREEANEYFGTESGLWAIVAGVYLSLMGPKGMKELGELIISRSNYAAKRLSEIPKIKVNPSGGKFFQEFIIDFNNTGFTVKEINNRLLDFGIFGGKDLSNWFPEYGQIAMYCFGEKTDVYEIDKLYNALSSIIGGMTDEEK